MILWIAISFSALFLILIQLESIFYFNPNKKIFFFLSSSITLSLIIIYWFFYSSMAKKDMIKKYKFEFLAKKLGHKVFPEKNDYILNALQLESGTGQDESKELAKSYIKEIVNQLKDINLHNYFSNHKAYQLKSVLLVLWTCFIAILFMNYEPSASAFYRLSNPKEEFLAPKPFKLSSLTGNLHIIGGEEIEVFIKADPPITDTL